MINFNSERWLTEVFIQYKDELKSDPNLLLSEFVRSKAHELDNIIDSVAIEYQSLSGNEIKEGDSYVV